MKTINYFKKFLLLFVLLLSYTGFSQVSGTSFTYTLSNGVNTSSTTFEVDVILNVNHTGIALSDGGLKIAQISFGVNFNNLILNGGTPTTVTNDGTWFLIPGTRDGAFNGQVFAQDGTYRGVFTVGTDTFGQLRVVGTLISGASSVLVPNGSYRIGRYRFTNTVAWTNNSNARLWINPNNTGGSTNSLITAYKNGTTTSGYGYTTSLPAGAPGVIAGYTLAAPFSLPLNANVCATSGSVIVTNPLCFGGTGSASVTLSPTPVPALSSVSYKS